MQVQDPSEPLRRALRQMRAQTSQAIEDGPKLSAEYVAARSEQGVLVDTWLHRAASPCADVLFDLHGGGFALGDARKTDAMLEWIAHSWDVNVVSVGYRLSPECPYPAALDDVCAAIDWYVGHAREFNLGSMVYLQGYSAGANLALCAAMRLAMPASPGFTSGVGDARVSGLALHYPVFDVMSDPALKSVRDIDIPVEFMSAFNKWYAGDTRSDHPEISPVLAQKSRLALLPKTFIFPVVGDALCDEALLLASRIKSCGGCCEVKPVAGAYHGYIEDAANTAVYEATSFPATRAARPSSYRAVAQESLAAGLHSLLGDAVLDIPFPQS